MIFDQVPLTRLIGLATGVGVNVQRITERALKPVGLTYAQFGLLTAAAEREGQSQRELTVRLEGDSTTVMVIVDSLEKKGLAERRPDPTDRRRKRIHLTPRGKRTALRALETVKNLYEPLLAEFTEREISAAIPVLERLYMRLRDRRNETNT